MNEAEMLYFYSKLPDPARCINSEHLGNVFVFVWAYKINAHVLRIFLSFTVSKITEKAERSNQKKAWLLA